MARTPRVVVEGGLYHVYNRVSSGEQIFADPNVAVEFIEIVREVKKRDDWTMLAWCLMSNHYHLIVRTSSVPLWRGMHGIQNRFSRGFNRRFGRTGGVWQGRYKAKFIEDQSYLDRLVLYVHLNPVTAGLVEDLSEYPFGGHREVKREIPAPLVDIDEMLLCFGETKKVARRNYLRAIQIGINPDALEIESSWHPLDPVKDDPLELNANTLHVDVLGRSTDLERPTLEAGEFIRRICELTDFDFDYLASRARDRDTASKRRMIATLGVERWRQKGTEIAAVLNKNPDVVSWWVGEGVRRRLEDQEFAAELERLDEALSTLLTPGER